MREPTPGRPAGAGPGPETGSASRRPDPTRRFSARVDAYDRWRPGYPPELIPLLTARIGLRPAWIVADVGAGTGIASALFIGNGNTVFAVEPNAAMRRAAAGRFRDEPRFRPIDGRAEATTLPDASVDLAFAAQAFHWFDLPRARAEFARILRPERFVALVWNTRRTDATPFMRAFEELVLRHGTDYRDVRHERVGPPALAGFFGGPFTRDVLANEQSLDREGLRGRLLSSSYLPAPDDAAAGPLLEEADRIFDSHQQRGVVRIRYDTEVYCGRLA